MLGLSLGHWLIVLLVVVLVFGTSKLRNVGKDLGDAVRGFKEGIKGEDAPTPQEPAKLTESKETPPPPQA